MPAKEQHSFCKVSAQNSPSDGAEARPSWTSHIKHLGTR